MEIDRLKIRFEAGSKLKKKMRWIKHEGKKL